MKLVVGIDEVGRGPLAGPVTVCVVVCDIKTYSILKKSKNLPELGKDSKKLKAIERESYSKVLKFLSKENKISFSVTHISNKVIDSKGISFAIKMAINNNIKRLKLNSKNSRILLDGRLKVPAEFINQRTIIKGDEKEKIIAWASILAKVSRDALMLKISKKFPYYGFDMHKGYGTKLHTEAIVKYGLSSVHRRSFCKKY